MARKAAEFEEQAGCLFIDVFLTMPKQYKENPDSDDAICQAWNESQDATMRASIALQRLGDLLRAKAGITEPGPSEKFCKGLPENKEKETDSVKS